MDATDACWEGSHGVQVFGCNDEEMLKEEKKRERRLIRGSFHHLWTFRVRVMRKSSRGAMSMNARVNYIRESCAAGEI
jgi:hypothetical protein